MTNLIIQVSKYLIIILMALYTFQCFTVFQKKDDEAREYLFLRQNMLMFAMHFVAYTVLYLEKPELSVLLFYGAQVIYLAAVLVLFRESVSTCIEASDQQHVYADHGRLHYDHTAEI